MTRSSPARISQKDPAPSPEVACWTAVAAALLLICVGCRPQEQIRTYEVERTEPPHAPFDAAEARQQLHHTWAAMLPVGDKVWFFKISGTSEAVARHREEVTKFLSSVSADESADAPLRWQLPDGWTEKGPSEMRLATLVIPDEHGDLELAISSLPLSGEWRDFVAINVNRWLRQLSQPELTPPTIMNLTHAVETAAGKATVVELAGVPQAQPGMNPHAANPHAGMAQAQRSPASSTTGEASKSELSYEAPPEWQPGRLSMMRKAAFEVSSGEHQAEVTVIDMSTAAGPQITDVQANIQRWASQVGLPADADLKQFLSKISIDGNEATYARLIGPESDSAPIAMLAAMLVRKDKVWFFKLFGDKEVVESESENFEQFLRSIHFK